MPVGAGVCLLLLYVMNAAGGVMKALQRQRGLRLWIKHGGSSSPRAPPLFS